MNGTGLILRAYYEALYDRLEAGRDRLADLIGQMLTEELARRKFEGFERRKYAAYLDACIAFIDERIEMYNPIGAQYTFDRSRSRQAFELEMQLDWYDSRAEFEALVAAARRKAEAGLKDEALAALAAELIAEVGAFPNGSIISTYEAEPTPAKLPDYVAARAIAEVIT